MNARLFLCGVLMTAAATGSAGAGEHLSMKASPVFSFAPANFNVRADIEADANNRAVEIVAESPDFYRSSEIQLDGERAPRVTSLEFRSLPAGLYEVSVTVLGADGHSRAVVRQEVNVVASGRER